MKFNIATVSLILLAASSLAVPTPNDAKDLDLALEKRSSGKYYEEGKAKETDSKAKK
ncbi:5020_t:CDS:2, partial [Dentiscutata erythropus]